MKHILSRKFLIFLLLTIAVVAGIIIFVRLRKDSGADSQGGINYDPPTQEERQATEKHKESIANGQSDEPETDEGVMQSVTPFITVASQFNDAQHGNRIEVRAYIPKIVQSGGTCTVTLKQDDQTVSRQVSAQADAQTTVCDAAMIPRGEFPSGGTWSATVEYKSSNAQGVSDTMQVEIQ